ncbi:MAG: flagellar hook-length control protein FliK [Nitrospira defluvii]|nr:flagellar hook-length control protein FliK [Nitrospira defluvii]
MATDMQPFLSGLSSAGNHSASDMRDRNAGLPPSSSANRFDTMLGTAEARRTGAGHESMPVRPQYAAHPRAATDTTTKSRGRGDISARIAATARHERSATQTERTQSQRAEESESGQDDQTTEARDTSNQSATLSPEMLLAAGMVPQALTGERVAAQADSPSDDAPHAADTTVGEVQSATATELSSPDSQPAATTQSASLLPPGQTPGQVPADATAKGAADRFAGPTKASDTPTAESGNPDAALLSQAQKQDAPPETPTGLNDGLSKGAPIEPDKAKLEAIVINTHMTEKATTNTDAAEQADLQPMFDSVMPVSDASAGQGASSAEHFFGQDDQSSSDSRGGPDHSKSNLLSPDDHTLRPQFLDQATGISPSAPSSSDSRVGRSETGQATIVHASESERVSGAYPSAQTVTLDLDPLDMGPLRVRIMMTDQTVHAHIRTEHGELGQGLLRQGQSLEASLRTTGLEMGMLRVTVDQQQQGQGENAWAFQQQQGRPGLASGLPSASGEEERTSRVSHGYDNNGHVSFFA